MFTRMAIALGLMAATQAAWIACLFLTGLLALPFDLALATSLLVLGAVMAIATIKGGLLDYVIAAVILWATVYPSLVVSLKFVGWCLDAPRLAPVLPEWLTLAMWMVAIATWMAVTAVLTYCRPSAR
jgi:hypothetical protein